MSLTALAAILGGSLDFIGSGKGSIWIFMKWTPNANGNQATLERELLKAEATDDEPAQKKILEEIHQLRPTASILKNRPLYETDEKLESEIKRILEASAEKDEIKNEFKPDSPFDEKVQRLKKRGTKSGSNILALALKVVEFADHVNKYEAGTDKDTNRGRAEKMLENGEMLKLFKAAKLKISDGRTPGKQEDHPLYQAMHGYFAFSNMMFVWLGGSVLGLLLVVLLIAYFSCSMGGLEESDEYYYVDDSEDESDDGDDEEEDDE